MPARRRLLRARWGFALAVGAMVWTTVSHQACSQDTDPPAKGAQRPAVTTSDPVPMPSTEGSGWPPASDRNVELSQDLLTQNFFVVLDGSGSMNGRGCSGKVTKAIAARTALEQFAGSIGSKANLGLLTFDKGGVRTVVPLGQGNREAFRTQVNSSRAGGGTPLRHAIAAAYDGLVEQGRRQLGYGEYHLVVVTDGVAEPSNQDPTNVIAQILRESPVVLHTIGFCIGEDHVLNQRGRTLYKAANSPEELAAGLGAVLAESPTFDVTAF